MGPPVAPLANLQWGKWEKSNGNGRRHYALEVAQHPIRARMCGFGDKDRRPLAPAAIAKMIVRDEQNEVIPAEDIELDFFLVTCDLWSADGQMEVNLVRNPSSSASRGRRKEQGQAGSDDGEFAAAGPSREQQDVQPPHIAQAMTQGLPPSDVLTGAWGQSSTYQPQAQPAWNVPGMYADPQSQRHMNYPDAVFGSGSAMGTPTSQGWGPDVNQGGSIQPYDPRAGALYPTPTPPIPPSQVPSSRADRDKETSGSYTRTLVGPLSANAARLYDDRKQLGIFFTFQDLSVRTEGTFRLRLRLVNVGAPPAPNRGAMRVHENVSPVLAQTFTEPFTVFSAKKFPGVPSMTPLSLEFGRQGQKLPLRNRPGSTGRAKTRGGDSEEEDDSGGGSGAEEA